MSPSEPPSGSLGQSIYTWSRSRLDRTKGMGFCAVSTALEADIDWLAKLNPPEFQLFREDADASPELYEARVGFSAVGRTVLHDKAILYRKTADGSFDDANRPQLLVHALIGSPAVLGLSRMSQVREDIWIREVNSSALGDLRLTDRALAEVLTGSRPQAEHVCPDDHQGALGLLRMIADADLNGQGVIEVPAAGGDLGPVFLAFPAAIADGFSLDPYVAVSGVEHYLTLRPPSGALARPAQAADATSDVGTCPLGGAGRRAAGQFLRSTEPDFRSYARAVLASMDQSVKPLGAGAPHEPAEPAGSTVQPDARPELADDINPVMPLLDQVRPGVASLTGQENRALLNLLAPSHADDVLALDDAVLTQVFGGISGKDLIWKWHVYFKDEPADTFTRLWNRTRVAAFLGIVMTKNLATPDGSARIDSDRGLFPDVTSEMLKSMPQYKFGSRALVEVIERGYGDAGATRQFIAKAFADDPYFLFDMVLKNVTMPVAHMIDYLRSGFEQWWPYRRLPEEEAAALHEMLQPTFFDRVKVIFKR